MISNEVPRFVEVPTACLVDLAVESWRLSRWLAGVGPEQPPAVARHVARRLADFLRECSVQTLDITGQQCDPGLAVEVLDTVPDPDLGQGDTIIHETVSPIVQWRGIVVRQGQVVTRRRPVSERTSSEGADET